MSLVGTFLFFRGVIIRVEGVAIIDSVNDLTWHLISGVSRRDFDSVLTFRLLSEFWTRRDGETLQETGFYLSSIEGCLEMRGVVSKEVG
jgi:hypothetical protein